MSDVLKNIEKYKKRSKTVLEKCRDVIQNHFMDELYEFVQNYPHQKNIVLDFPVINQADYELADLILDKPIDVIKAFRKAMVNLNVTQTKIYEDDMYVCFANCNFNTLKSLKELRSEYIGKLVTFEALVKRKGDILPRRKLAMFECRGCMRMYEVPQKSSEIIVEPATCTDCGTRSFRLIDEESTFIDTQTVLVQDPLEGTRGIDIPREMEMVMDEDLIETVVPGQDIRVTGVLKVRLKNKILRHYIDVSYVETLGKEYEDVDISEEDIIKIKEFAKDPDLFDKFTVSIIPNIYGYWPIKKAIALQLFGGTEKIFQDGGRKRPDIHLLLVGDPGIGKSEMIKRTIRISPRGVYTSGKGSTSAGLTASVIKEENGSFALEAGALVIGDKGIVGIDEFDKMRADDRSALHEALEQQTVSIAKAGITATLNTRCSALAGANPKYGKFDSYKSVMEQVNLPAPILSRFDLIFIMEDKPDEKKDRVIAQHILDLHETNTLHYELDAEFLQKYVAYARITHHPKVKGKVKEQLMEFYLNIRGMVESSEDPIPITPRQLEGLIRLTEASAKAHLRDEATEQDANIAIEIMTYYLNTIGFDPDTGKYDVLRMEGKKPKSWNDKVDQTIELLKELKEYYGDELTKDLEIEEIIYKLHVDEKTAKKLITEAKWKR